MKAFVYVLHEGRGYNDIDNARKILGFKFELESITPTK